MRGYEKKIIQYDYLLESKELKYEKLKNLYADAVKETDYDYFPERNKEIRITRDNSKY